MRGGQRGVSEYQTHAISRHYRKPDQSDLKECGLGNNKGGQSRTRLHSGLTVASEQGHLTSACPSPFLSLSRRSGLELKRLRRQELPTLKNKFNLREWLNKLKSSGKGIPTEYFHPPKLIIRLLNDFSCVQAPGASLIETSGAHPLFPKSYKFVPLLHSLICGERGWLGRAPWCGFPSQEAAGSSASRRSPIQVPGSGKASLKNPVTVGETGTGSLPIFSQVVLPTACCLQKRKKPA